MTSKISNDKWKIYVRSGHRKPLIHLMQLLQTDSPQTALDHVLNVYQVDEARKEKAAIEAAKAA